MPKFYSILIASCLMGWTGGAFGQTVVPQDRELGRYEMIWQRSPFVAVSQVSPEVESLAKRYAITGFARVGGKDVVFLFDRKGLGRFTLANGLPSNGMELVSVSEGLEAKDLKAVVRVGGELAEIAFDPVLNAEKGHTTQNAAPTAATEPVTTVPLNANVLTGGAKPNSQMPPRPVKTLRRKPISPQ